MEYTANTLNEVDAIKSDLTLIKHQDEILMQNLLQISKTIQKAASACRPVPRLVLGRTYICRHGHTNCLGHHGPESHIPLKKTRTTQRNVSESLKNLKDITSSIEDMSFSDVSDFSSSDTD
ncbi:uncharacterized protein LOC125675953 [Ostrea edulis]|uniref:uncharacterized protein LOC125675953 n=1 Tax=Ostrea edulis TaxID=37623 RepID=UPI0020961FC1|nr:uncharacterized protein LOC125675953 [Ostrea edulis]